MNNLDYNSFSIGVLFLAFSALVLLTYDIIFKTVDSVASGRTLRLIPLKSLLFPVRSIMKDLSHYPMSGLISISSYIVVVTSVFFCTFYYLIVSYDVNLPFYLFPMSFSFISVFLCRGVYSEEDVVVSKAYKSISILIVSFILVIVSFIFLAMLIPGFSVMSSMAHDIGPVQSWKVIPSMLTILLAAYFILDEMKQNDEIMWSSSVVGRMYYYMLLLHVSSVFITVMVFPFARDLSIFIQDLSAYLGNDSFFSQILLYSYSETVFVLGPLKLFALWAILALLALLISMAYRSIPKLNQKTKMSVVLKVSFVIIVINFLTVILS